jgi:hypothetical protein
MTVRVAAIALAPFVMTMTMALTGAASRAQSIAMTPALTKVVEAAKPEPHARQLSAALAAKGVSFTDVSIAWWRAHPGIDDDNQKLAKLPREK